MLRGVYEITLRQTDPPEPGAFPEPLRCMAVGFYCVLPN